MSNPKRKIDQLKDAQEETSSTELHFGIEMLSPLKKAASGVEYYSGRVTDGSSSLRLVGFNREKQEELSKLAEQRTPIKASNCAIRKSRTNQSELEIHIGKGTSFSPSPRRLDFKYVQQQPSVNTVISNLNNIDDGILVNVSGKVAKVFVERTVSTGSVVQEIEIHDETGMAIMSVWNQHVDKISESITYHFTNLLVKTFRDEKRLSFTNTSTYTAIEASNIDFTTICTDKTEHVSMVSKLLGVQGFSIHYWCLYCSAKLPITELGDTTSLLQCNKCHLLQSTSSCEKKVTCKLLFREILPPRATVTESDHHDLQLLSISTEWFCKLLGSNLMPNSDVILMEASISKIFMVTYANNIITSIEEQPQLPTAD